MRLENRELPGGSSAFSTCDEQQQTVRERVLHELNLSADFLAAIPKIGLPDPITTTAQSNLP